MFEKGGKRVESQPFAWGFMFGGTELLCGCRDVLDVVRGEVGGSEAVESGV